jgi:hypothetical protein
MRMNIHDVASIEVEGVEHFPSVKARTLIIRDADGKKYEITLFASDVDKLKIEIN